MIALATILSLADIADAWCDPEWGPCGRQADAPSAPSLAEEAELLGLHAVTTVKVADERSTSDGTTTYTTTTAAMNAGTFARKVASVTTGEVTPYDLATSGERMMMSDGRSVAGDWYANYVVRDGRLALDRYVFFADDSETARARVPQPTTAAPLPSQRPAVITVVQPTASAAPSSTRPLERAPRPAPPPPATPVPVSRVDAAVALEPAGDELGKIEILRGRPVELWLRARVNGQPAGIVRWTYVSGEVIALGPLSGSGAGPFRATWRSVTGSGEAYVVRLRATVAVPGEGEREADATVEVTVLAPAIVE